jgi:N-acetylglucosaminyl-diphospho-decaprenol L-rhamnosyltransferase
VEAPSASIIIVSYESRTTIGACLTSIRDHAGCPVETIVVDNASADDTAGYVREAFPEIHLLPQSTNRGFAAGCNIGASVAARPYLLFLNPDTELLPGALPELMRFMEGTPRVAAAGPRLIFPDGGAQDGAFRYPTLLMTWLEFFPRPGRLIHSRLNGRVSALEGKPVAIDHPLGACMLVRRAAWEDVGPFDERFFLYCEEVDWSMRAKSHGWQIMHVPTATVVHHGGVSAASAPAASLAHLYSSRARLHAKHRGRAFQAAARGITRLGLSAERSRLKRLQRASRIEGTPPVAERLAGVERALQVLRQLH